VTEASDVVQYRVENHVAVITLNRPDRLNALVPGMGELYAELLRHADDDPRVRAIVVTGAGRGFCSGADLAVLAQGGSALVGYLDGQSIDTLPTAALGLGTPVATAVNGPCAGIGFVLAISADARFASSSATFSATFSRLGLIAEYGVAWLLTRLVGLGRATDLLVTGRTIDAAEAERWGLVNEVADDALAAAMAWARDVAAHCSPSAVAVIKRQLLEADRQTLRDSVESALVEMRQSFARPDLAEAIRARQAAEPPAFPARTGGLSAE
jgi:enoyl-CoA hydratase/carnithine racemase